MSVLDEINTTVLAKMMRKEFNAHCGIVRRLAASDRLQRLDAKALKDGRHERGWPQGEALTQ